MISVSDLSFEYDGKAVLHDVSFEIKQGSVVALVGPNGAGKTTLMRCLAALHNPVVGDISIDGVDAIENPREVRRRSGYLSDFFGLYDRLTVRQSLLHMAGCQYIPQKHIDARVDKVIRLTGLENYVDATAGTLSRGYRQRLGVALAIVHKPKILLLDEPASGMDPEARSSLSALIRGINEEGTTIIVSSHILAELEDYCSDMLVIRDGRVRKHMVHGAAQSDDTIALYAQILDVNDGHVAFFETHEDISNVKREADGVSFVLKGCEQDIPPFMKDVLNNDIPVVCFEVKKQTLQNAYMDLANEDNLSKGSDSAIDEGDV